MAFGARSNASACARPDPLKCIEILTNKTKCYRERRYEIAFAIFSASFCCSIYFAVHLFFARQCLLCCRCYENGTSVLLACTLRTCANDQYVIVPTSITQTQNRFKHFKRKDMERIGGQAINLRSLQQDKTLLYLISGNLN